MKPLRICLVAPHYPPFVGGVEVHVQQLAKGLAALGNQVDVLTQADSGEPASLELREEVRLQRFPIMLPSRHYSLAPALYRELRRRRADYDVFHAHAYHSLPSLATAIAGCRPLIFTPHYHGTGHSAVRRLLHPPYRRLGRLTFEAAARVICVSEPERALVARHFPQVADKLVTVPNGVDLAALRSAPGLPLAGPTLLVAGRIESYKRVDRLLGALARMPPDWRMAVSGNGPLRPQLQRLSRELGLSDRVQFLGNVPTAELYSWLRSAAVVASMSGHEAMPVVVVEALGAGTPVVLSPIPAHQALAERWPGAVTIVADPEDPEAVAAALVGAARNRPSELRVPSWPDVVRETLALYQTVTSG